MSAEEHNYRRITLDFDTYSNDLSLQFEKGRKQGCFEFIQNLMKLLEGPGNGESFSEELREFFEVNEIYGVHKQFLEKLITVSFGNMAKVRGLNV